MTQLTQVGQRIPTLLGSLFLVFLLFACGKNLQQSRSNTFIFKPTVQQTSPAQQAFSWQQQDSVGVFFVERDAILAKASIVGGIANTAFVYNNGMLINPYTLEDQSLSARVVAYYPYRKITGYRVPFDISDQSNQHALDFMFAEGYYQSQSPINLAFEQQLAKLVIPIKLSDNLPIRHLSVTVNSVKSRANFDLKTGELIVTKSSTKKIEGTVLKQADGSYQAEFTLLPGEEMLSKNIQFTFTNGQQFNWNIPEAITLAKGELYTYPVHINKNGIVVEESTLAGYFETPTLSMPTADAVHLRYNLPDKKGVRNFSMLYDKGLGIAYWVAYPLHSSYLGNAKRTDEWAYDPRVARTDQATLFSSYADSDYDRGHQLPSADRNYSTEGNKTTFYFTNFTPQLDRLNQGMWANLETKVRTWTAKCDTMYVVTGAMPTSPNDKKITYVLDKSGKKIAKPQYFFKALAMKIGNNYHTIAFKINNELPTEKNFMSYTMDVARLEEITGFTFFPNLTKAQKNSINTKIWTY